MSKFFNFLEKYDNFKRLIQWGIYIVIAIASVSTLVGVIFGVRSCKSNNTIETVEAKYFMNEVVEVHGNIDINVYYAKTVDAISYHKEKKFN